MRQVLLGFVVVLWSSALFAQPPTDRSLPKVPVFNMPTSAPGFVGVRQLRVDGRKFLDTEIKVNGYIIWIYDCLTATTQPGESRAKAQKRIDEDPTQCERKKFYLGQTPKEAPERGLWIVDVPRPPNKLERERLPKEELASWPKPPQLKLGDYVTVTGKFTVASPHNERNSDGLVVFASLAPAKKPTSAKPTVTAASVSPPPVPSPTIKAVTVKPKDEASRMLSIKYSNEATKAYGAKNYADAIASYTKAANEWPGNHVAFYGLAGSHIGTKNWAAAADATLKAIELEPGQAMYHMVYGYTVYEAAIATAREAEAKKLGRKPSEVAGVDLSAINFDKALSHLAHAAKLEPGIWRAHYYIGRIYRDRGNDGWAAESFNAALRSVPTDPGPWIALGELYRRWDFVDEAIAVAKLGTQTIHSDESSDIWYVLGMAYDDKGDYKQSIEAFTRAMETRMSNAKAVFQRGQSYFRRGEFAKAKVDLEAFVKVADGYSSIHFPKQQAIKMLMDIAAEKK